jgi:hypothetical protein
MSDAETTQNPSLRPIGAIELNETTPGGAPEERPGFDWIDPRTLLVDESYQRALSKRSLELIRRIVGAWDWRKFKPPIVAETPAGLVVIDGQHTAIAAASHPSVELIPIMLVKAAEVADQAMAFVGQNRDRLYLSPAQVHKAAVTAGEPEAAAIETICARVGVKILQGPPGRPFEAGETLAAASLLALYQHRGGELLETMLRILASAEATPIRATHLKALELLLTEPEYRDSLEPDDLAATFVRMGPKLERDAGVLAATHRLRQWRALAITLYRNTRHVRRRAA